MTGEHGRHRGTGERRPAKLSGFLSPTPDGWILTTCDDTSRTHTSQQSPAYCTDPYHADDSHGAAMPAVDPRCNSSFPPVLNPPSKPIQRNTKKSMWKRTRKPPRRGNTRPVTIGSSATRNSCPKPRAKPTRNAGGPLSPSRIKYGPTRPPFGLGPVKLFPLTTQ
ncbi:hypothetical protein B0T16DRAFT_221252 [Cercophora newfieldiana]|uniref:Uncharacterized protein n=1 Tax=Cercophora newfieldiana TaxID=92897 RepID=A0AA40CLG9_9PEZI|nr:hypothetical protein B0T16DRAFT_221252 [Cercophora newfieldiana]